jgi:ammonia channel protein AmtB
VSKSLIELHRERGQLRERIAHQRTSLALALAPLQQVEQAGSRVAVVLGLALQRMRDNPVPVLVAVAALVVWRPRRTWHWARRGIWLWRKYLAIRSVNGL